MSGLASYAVSDTAQGVLAALEQGDFQAEFLREALQFSGSDQAELHALARQRRDEFFPERQVEVRSVIEISNHCYQRCTFCNINRDAPLERYTISNERLLLLIDFLYGRGRRVFLLQSGESRAPAFIEQVRQLTEEVKRRYPDCEIILCLGNLSERQYATLRAAGADRYILKFETGNARLYHELKPTDTLERRLNCLEMLLNQGFKVGTGNIVGFPGQTLDDLVEDLLLMGRYPLDMSSCTVFIPGEGCALREAPGGDPEVAFNMMALVRILYPDRLIPTTSSLEKAFHDGQYLGLMAGANTVTIHDGTPSELKELFPIYSTLRFAPATDHLARAVAHAGLTFSPKPLLGGARNRMGLGAVSAA